jgi:hypothetical protein
MAPLLPPDTVATPLLKLIAVADPNGTAVPLLFLTVGTVTGLAELPAPEKIKLLIPL